MDSEGFATLWHSQRLNKKYKLKINMIFIIIFFNITSKDTPPKLSVAPLFLERKTLYMIVKIPSAMSKLLVTLVESTNCRPSNCKNRVALCDYSEGWVGERKKRRGENPPLMRRGE